MNNKSENFEQTGAVFRWRPTACLSASGEDAFPFLQGQFSNDLRPLEQGRPVYGLWLDRKGKVLADSFVLADPSVPGRYRIVSHTSPADTIRQRLEDFIIADDVVLVDETSEWTGLTLSARAMSPRVREVLQALGAFSFAGRRGFPAEEWLLPLQCTGDASLSECLRSIPEMSPTEMEAIRIAARIPAVPLDIGPADLPQEGGLETDAVSFSKGCYLGQEVMARLKTMGTVRRQLFRVRAAGEAPPLPAPLFQNGKRCGELRTAVARDGGFVGLALLSTMNLLLDAPLHVAEGMTGSNVFIDSP